MYRKILTLIRHTAVYGLGSVGPRVVGFLLIPIYTRFMTPADYGVLALCTTTAGMLKILSLAGIPSGLLRSYLHVARSDEERRRVQSTALLALLVVGFGVFGLLAGFRDVLATWIFGDQSRAGFILLIAVANLCGVIPAFRNANFRIHDQSTRFAFFTLLAFVINVGLSIALVVGLRQGAWGAMTANTVAVILMALLFLPWSLKHLRAGLSRTVLRDLLAYGLPLIPAGVALWVMNFSDVYILRIFREPEEIGLYNLGYRFGLGILILTNSLKLAYPKVFFTEGSSDEGPALFSRVVTYYVAGMGSLCLATAVFAPQIILIADRRFQAAWQVIPLVVFAYFFNGLVPILQIGMDLRNKMHYYSVVFVLGGALNVGLNLIFVPRFGMMGAAATTLVTFVLLPIPIYLISSRLYPLRLEWGRLVRVAIVLVTAGGLAGWALPFESTLALIAAKAGLCLSIGPVLYLVGFFTDEEIGKLRSLWRRR